MNERVAAHKSRRSSPAAEPVQFPQAHPGNQRAAAAAARVAARFAKAPGYSDLLMDGARAAVRAAEAASRAALEAKAAAESMSKLAELEAQRTIEVAARPRFASEVEEIHPSATDPAELEAGEPEAVALPAPVLAPVPAPDFVEDVPPVAAVADSRSYQVRWAPELPALQTEPAQTRAQHDEWAEMDAWRQSLPSVASAVEYERAADQEESLEMVEAIQPIPANLIEFPREIVAPRKVRPRLAEAPAPEEPEPQLSIWEVDPKAVSTEPAPAEPQVAASVPAWTEPLWSGMKLDAQPRAAYSVDLEAQLDAEEEEQRLRELAKPSAEPALLSLRLLAAVVDFTLTIAALLGVFYMASNHLHALPPLRTVEVDCAVAFLAAAGIYMALFHFLAYGTPGMKFARIALSTLDGKTPTRGQCIGRFVALMVSVLPVGLGLVWAVFDEERLCWHDRLSRTYLRKI